MLICTYIIWCATHFIQIHSVNYITCLYFFLLLFSIYYVMLFSYSAQNTSNCYIYTYMLTLNLFIIYNKKKHILDGIIQLMPNISKRISYLISWFDGGMQCICTEIYIRKYFLCYYMFARSIMICIVANFFFLWII